MLTFKRPWLYLLTLALLNCKAKDARRVTPGQGARAHHPDQPRRRKDPIKLDAKTGLVAVPGKSSVWH